MLLQQHYCDFYHYPNMQEIQYSSEVSSHNNWSLSEGDNLHWKKVILYAVVSWIRLAVAYITPNTIHD